MDITEDEAAVFVPILSPRTADGSSFVASVTFLACDRGNFTPVTYTCNEVAYAPQYVTYSAAWWMFIGWLLSDLVET